MKECEWCGDDFRGEAETFEGHLFCCKECMEEWRKDMLAEAEPEQKKE